jgi:VanZ family protein
MAQYRTIAARLTAWGLAIAIVVLSLVPPNLRPETAAPHDVEHFLIYYGAAFAFALGYEVRYTLLVALLVIFSAAVELAQLFVPGRHARLSDFVVDAFSMCAGVVTARLMWTPQSKLQASSTSARAKSGKS